MPTTLNRAAYIQLLEGNLQWLRQQTQSPERAHIILLLEQEKITPFHYHHAVEKGHAEAGKDPLCTLCHQLPGFPTPPTLPECEKCHKGNYTDRIHTKKCHGKR